MENVTQITQNTENAQKSTIEYADFGMIFSIKDLKSNTFGSLYVANTNEEAIRACKIRLLYERDSLIQQFPADYMLYHVGYFNSTTGVVDSCGVAIPVKSLFDISCELEQERKQRPIDVPEFMKGDSDVNGSEESSSCECVGSSV